MKYKSFAVGPSELKADVDGRMIEGYAALFGSLDSKRDIIVKGAFEQTIRNRFFPPGSSEGKNKVRKLWNHNKDTVIGRITELYEDDTGLRFKAKLIEGVQAADETLLLIKEDAINEMSFGYDVKNSRMDDYTDDTGQQVRARFLEDIKLYEISPVTFGANDDTVVEAANLEGIVDNVRELKEGRMLSESNMKRIKTIVDGIKEPLQELEKILEEARQNVDGDVDLSESEDDEKAGGEPDEYSDVIEVLDDFANSI